MKKPQGLHILFEDSDIVVVDKAAGLLTIGTDRERERTAYFRLTDYVRRGNPRSRERIFVVHRLDRDASGVIVFARHPEAKMYLQGNWDEFEKRYLALVHGAPRERTGRIASYLTENRAQIVHATRDTVRGKFSETDYQVLRELGSRSVLEVVLLTGRKHQIRVHLADLGTPIVGDKKYGKKDGAARLALHAWKLKLRHPRTGDWMSFEARPPAVFKL